MCFFSDLLSNDVDHLAAIFQNMTYHKTNFLSIFEQRFEVGKSEHDVLNNEMYWTKWQPHESSGPCETYDPPYKSDPGYEISMYMKMNSSEWDSKLDIFLHEKDKFFYSTAPTYNVKLVDAKALDKSGLQHPRATGTYILTILPYHAITILSKLSTGPSCFSHISIF